MKAVSPNEVQRFSGITETDGLTKRQQHAFEEVVLEINTKLRSMTVDDDQPSVSIVFRDDYRAIFWKLKEFYVAAGWSDMKFSFTDNGFREPDYRTVFKLYF